MAHPGHRKVKPAAQRRGPPVAPKQPRKVDLKAGLKKVGRALTSALEHPASPGEFTQKYRTTIASLSFPGGIAKTAAVSAGAKFGLKSLIKKAAQTIRKPPATGPKPKPTSLKGRPGATGSNGKAKGPPFSRPKQGEIAWDYLRDSWRRRN